jgi:hypothetical protein
MIYELRIYTANPGKMPALQARFRDHTCALFEKHGITNVAYWTNLVGGRNDELWYVLGHEDLAARQASWTAFIADPERVRVFDESETDGPLVHHFENRMFSPTDFSPLR